MKAIRRDPDTKLLEAQTSLAQAEERIQVLQVEREQKLAEPEFAVQDIARIDQELTTLQANIVIFRQRETKMLQKQRERDRARRGEEKKAAVADIEKRLVHRLDLARKLDEALRVIEGVVPDLLSADDQLYRNWSDTLPDARLLAWTRASRCKDLSSLRSQRLLPGLVKAIADQGSFGFAETIEQNNRELIEELQRAEIPDTDTESEAA